MAEDKEVTTCGWDAITAAFRKLYPGQEDPLHFGTLISWRLGGNDPLNGVSVYDGGEFWHFVTFGFSELYEKEQENTEYSGYGFELTIKLKKTAGMELADKDQLAGCPEIRGMVGILQSLARYSFEGGEIFRPYEYIYTGQESGMDPDGKSAITGFITVPDDAGEIDTPNGKVEFVQLVGASDKELKAIMDKQIRVKETVEKLGTVVTDYWRSELKLD